MGENASRPIIFSAPMVRALLEGRKTQTRRLVSPDNFRLFSPDGGTFKPTAALMLDAFRDASPIQSTFPGSFVWRARAFGYQQPATETRWQGSSMIEPGQRLWVREAVQADDHPEEDIPGVRYLADDTWMPVPATEEAQERHFLLRCYRSTDPDLDAYKPVPSIHMPRWCSRLTLTVTDVRVHRLHEMPSADAVAEGIEQVSVDGWRDYEGAKREGFLHPVGSFASLWDNLHRKPGTTWRDNPHVIALTFTVARGNIDHCPVPA